MDKHIPELGMKRNFIGKIAGVFVGRFQLTILLVLMVVGLGISSVWLLPKESLPEIVFPTMIVQTIYPGAGPEDVEDLVTNKIESRISGLEDLDEVVSESNTGFSVVTLTFLEGTDMERKKLELQNELADIPFPEAAQEPSVRIFKSTELPVMRFSVSGEYSIFTLTNIADDIKEGLEGVTGVEEVNLFGGLQRQIQVVVNQPKLLEYGLTTSDIQAAISGVNVGFPVGDMDLSNMRFSIRVDEKLTAADELEKVVLTTGKGSNILLGDVATILDTSEPLEEFNRTYVQSETGEPVFSSILVEVLREKGADVLGTSENIQAYLERSRGSVYPEDVRVFISDDEADRVQQDLDNIQDSAFSGLIVVVIVLFLFIGFRESLIVSITIPMSLLATLTLLNAFGITLNTFAVLGMIVALGLLVDNSIIVMENMDRLKSKGLTSKDASLLGTNQVGIPILASTMTTVAAFFPLAILPGIVGAFINTIPRTIIIALLSSLVISVTITPAVYYRMMRRRERMKVVDIGYIKQRLMGIASLVIVVGLSYWAFSDGGDAKLLGYGASAFFGGLALIRYIVVHHKAHYDIEGNHLIRWYKRVIASVIASPLKKAAVLFIGVAVLVGSVGLLGAGVLKVAFFPNQEPSSLVIDIDTPGGTTLDETAVITRLAEDLLQENEAIASYNVTIGGNEVDRALINATLVDTGNFQVNGFEVAERVERDMKTIPGAKIIVSGSAGGGPPVGKPISMKLVGQDLEASAGLAQDYAAILEQIPGVYNVTSSVKEGQPQVVIDVLEKKAQTLGLSVSFIAQQLRSSVEGITATTLKDGTEEIDVVIRQDDMSWTDVASLRELYVRTPAGNMIPLQAVARLQEVKGVSSIFHEERERVVTIEADVRDGFNSTEAVAQFNDKAADILIPQGVRVQQSGDVEGIQESFGNLLQSMFLAVFLVFIILTVQFGSISQPFAILLTVPMALIGVIGGLVITGNEFGFYAFMGLVALVGIAVNDAIVLIDYMNYLRSTGKPLQEAIVEAGVTRFNPVLATTMTTIGGVLPLAFRDVYYAQFSYSLIFGLLVTTFLTLLYIPIVYSLIEGLKKKPEDEEASVWDMAYAPAEE